MTKKNDRSERTQLERCSFCGKTRRMVESLIAGPPGVYICNECIDLCNTILNEENRRAGPVVQDVTVREGGEETSVLPERLPTPAEIKAELDRHVIGQDHAKRVMSVAVYNHYKRIGGVKRKVKDETRIDPVTGAPINEGKEAKRSERSPSAAVKEEKDSADDISIDKSNILLIGPTGSGKTLLARTLARMLTVPFAIGDATTLTEAGYVGEDVENLLLKLMQGADFELARAERGIIFIDELDKIGRSSGNVSITRDVSGEGVQQSLLKMLEGTIANVPPQGGRKHPEQSYIQFNTDNVLFICGGSFVGIEEIIARRLGSRAIGFKHADEDGGKKLLDPETDRNELLRLVEPDDLVKFGLIPELIGRLPVLSALEELNDATLVRVLTEPRNAIVKQFQKIFAMEGATLEFSEEGLLAVARRAIERKTGARGLRAVIEDFMLDAQFELPSLKDGDKRFIVTPEVVRGDISLLDSTPEGARLANRKSAPAGSQRSSSRRSRMDGSSARESA